MTAAVRKTKIVATLGPSTTSVRTLRALVRAGVDVFRFNFSHGSHEEHAERVENVCREARALGRTPALLADLQGPKIRTGRTDDDREVFLKKGARVQVMPGQCLSDERRICVDYAGLCDDLKPGQPVLLNDGAVELRVRRVNRRGGTAECEVRGEGYYGSRKGVNLPQTTLRLPSLTAKDRRDLEFIFRCGAFDYIALSFVRSADDIKALRRAVDRARSPVGIIAKVEKPEAAREIEAILPACDGIMVARGDLGVETSTAEVPLLQKRLIAQANSRARLVIVATQMLESMIEHARPTRAEAADVANAILDGADAVMLSGETAVGNYPRATVETMVKIAEATEASEHYRRTPVDLSLRRDYPPHAVCEAASWASRDLGNAPVIVFTMSGATAIYLSKVRTFAPLFAFSPDRGVVRRLALAGNITAFHLPRQARIVTLQRKAEQILTAKRLIKRGDLVTVVSGTESTPGATSSLRVKRVGED